MNEYTKDPDSDVFIGLDWTDWLEEAQIISTSEWIIPDGLTGASAQSDGWITKIKISGGTLNAVYECVNRITTSAGETEDRTIRVKMLHK